MVANGDPTNDYDVFSDTQNITPPFETSDNSISPIVKLTRKN